MTEIGVFEAKTHLPRLLKQVEEGERFVITRHDRPVAELIPYRAHDGETVRGVEALAFETTLGSGRQDRAAESA